MTQNPDTMTLSDALTATRDSINQLKGKTTMAEAAPATETAKKPVKKVPVKKAATKKATPPARKELPNGHTSLADLCKKHKVEPVAARRRLRVAGIERKEGTQYSWPAGQLDKIAKIIKGEE